MESQAVQEILPQLQSLKVRMVGLVELLLQINFQAEVEEQLLQEYRRLIQHQDQAVLVQQVQLTQHQLQEQVEAEVEVLPPLQALVERQEQVAVELEVLEDHQAAE